MRIPWGLSGKKVREAEMPEVGDVGGGAVSGSILSVMGAIRELCAGDRTRALVFKGSL